MLTVSLVVDGVVTCTCRGRGVKRKAPPKRAQVLLYELYTWVVKVLGQMLVPVLSLNTENNNTQQSVVVVVMRRALGAICRRSLGVPFFALSME